MKDDNYEPPRYKKQAFHCPHCNAYAHQEWYYKELYIIYHNTDTGLSIGYNQCQYCKKHSLWLDKKMLYPQTSTAPLASVDMPDNVKKIYEEARQIATLSPKATAALLRVALEKLTEHLGETKGNLNTRIKNLKKQGLPEKVIQSADIIRVIANEGGSHAGTIDLTDKDHTETIDTLFFLINIIVEQTITTPKRIDNKFNTLPEDKKRGIENRDKEQP